MQIILLPTFLKFSKIPVSVICSYGLISEWSRSYISINAYEVETMQIYGTEYSRMDQVKFVEDSF